MAASRFLAKGRHRIDDNVKKILKKHTNVYVGSNHLPKSPKILNLIAGCFVALYNIELPDLKLTDIRPRDEKASRYYILLALVFYMQGSTPKTSAYKLFGFGYLTRTYVDDLFMSGYLEQTTCAGISRVNGRFASKQLDAFKLTSKGLDLVNHIFSLLIDDRLL